VEHEERVEENAGEKIVLTAWSYQSLDLMKD
jgi:hypothetical protein